MALSPGFSKRVVLLSLLALYATFQQGQAGESCCAKAAAALGGAEQEEWVPNLTAVQPEDWDEDEDGPWERPLMRKPKPSGLEVFRQELQNAVLDSCPWLLLGVLCNSAIQALSPSEDFLRRHLSGSKVMVLGKGAALGLMSPLCSCGALPMVSGMAGMGASPAAIVAFMVAAQSAGVDSLLFTLGVLGWRAAVLRLLAAAVIAIAVGAVVPRTAVKGHIVTKCSPEAHEATASAGVGQKLWTSLDAAVETFQEILPAVFFGFAATAAVTAVLPAKGLASAAAFGGLAGRAAVLGLALPMQFCEHAAVPLASALFKAGASGGLAFAVLATLPAINLSSLSVLATLTGPAGALRACLALWIVGLLGSFLADYMELQVVQIGEGGDALPEWYVQISQVLIALLTVSALVRLVYTSVSCASGAEGSCCAAKHGKEE